MLFILSLHQDKTHQFIEFYRETHLLLKETGEEVTSTPLIVISSLLHAVTFRWKVPHFPLLLCTSQAGLLEIDLVFSKKQMRLMPCSALPTNTKSCGLHRDSALIQICLHRFICKKEHIRVEADLENIDNLFWKWPGKACLLISMDPANLQSLCIAIKLCAVALKSVGIWVSRKLNLLVKWFLYCDLSSWMFFKFLGQKCVKYFSLEWVTQSSFIHNTFYTLAKLSNHD